MALPFSTPPFRIETGVLYYAALRGCRLDLVVNFLKYVVSLRMAALAGFTQLLGTANLTALFLRVPGSRWC